MFLGIDVHKREAQVAVRNDDGEVIEEVRVLDTDLEEIAQQYAGGKALLEATTNYFYTYDMLSEYLDVTVGHPPKLHAIAETDKKTDRIDAKELSRLVRVGERSRKLRPDRRDQGVPRTRAWPDQLGPRPDEFRQQDPPAVAGQRHHPPGEAVE